MLAAATAVAAAVAAGVAWKGVPVGSGQKGPAARDIRWRVRWAVWRWIAEVHTPDTGWTRVGEYETRALAKSNAEAAAASEHTGLVVQSVQIR